MTAPLSSVSLKAIVIRTHYVDRYLLSLAARLCLDPQYIVIFAVDERNGIVPTEGFPKVSISDEVFARLGLPMREQNEIWKCGDYVLYVVLDQFPDLDYVWLLENDAYVNRTEPLSFFESIDNKSQHDFVATYVDLAGPDWYWHGTMSEAHAEVYKCFFPVVRASAPAIRHLLSRRRSDAKLASLENVDYIIPNDEVFTTTELSAAGFSVMDVNSLGEYYTPYGFNYHGLFHPDDLKPEDGMLYHPVRSGLHYLRRGLLRSQGDSDELLRLLDRMTPDDLLEVAPFLEASLKQQIGNRGDDPNRILGRESMIWQIVVRFPQVPIVSMGARVLGEARMPFCLKVLRQYARFMGLQVDALENLALGRPAWQSSTCQWSSQQDYRKDAEEANNGDCDAHNGFHTDLEVEPWWTVDLLETSDIKLIRLFNRTGFEDRMKSFQIFTSLNGLDWHQIYQHGPEPEIARIVEICLPEVRSGRFLRVKLPRKSHLHFSELEVYEEVAEHRLSSFQGPFGGAPGGTACTSYSVPAAAEVIRRA